MTEREKGVATKPCPTCGTDLPVTVQPDGGEALATCPKCRKADEPQKSETASAKTGREQGTTTTTTAAGDAGKTSQEG